MTQWIEFIRSAVRPFIIVWSAVLYGVCLIKGIPVPDLLGGLVAAIIIEYFGERAVLRFKENISGGDTKGES
jgi:hypothetical protein